MNIVIATRNSRLAQIQTDIVGELIKSKHNINFNKLLIATEEDQRLDIAINSIREKAKFTKDIESALREGDADAAVHSMKHVPYKLAEEFEIIAMLGREDPRDAFVSNFGGTFNELRKGARIGTSSIRRTALIKAKRPDLEIIQLKGTIQNRFEKMAVLKLDGIILASNELKRLGLERVITEYLEPTEFLPAIGQGTLGIECLKTSPCRDLFKAIDNEDVRIQVEAERSFMKALTGDCYSPIGGYSKIEGDLLYLIGTCMIGGSIVKKDITGRKEEYIRLGEDLARKIIS